MLMFLFMRHGCFCGSHMHNIAQFDVFRVHMRTSEGAVGEIVLLLSRAQTQQV